VEEATEEEENKQDMETANFMNIAEKFVKEITWKKKVTLYEMHRMSMVKKVKPIV
jgi:hypothetical protein